VAEREVLEEVDPQATPAVDVTRHRTAGRVIIHLTRARFSIVEFEIQREHAIQLTHDVCPAGIVHPPWLVRTEQP
jgi:hypothetical protein